MISPLLVQLLVASFFVSFQVVAVTLNPVSFAAELRSPSLGLSPGTQVFLPTDRDFINETQRWTTHDAPTFIASVKPALESDVQKIVKVASAYDVPFLATGGGHGFTTTLGKLRNGIEIDLGFFHNVSVDAGANTMTIGGATRFREIFEPLYSAGKEIPTGASSCVGMLGATLGGGVGRYNGLHGMIADSLLSVRMVTGTGQMITASSTENTELFWGMRGAGFNYGIVMSATYRIYDLTSSQVMNADFIFPANASTAVLNYLKSYETKLPSKLAFIVLIGYSESFGGLFFSFNAIYAGPRAEGKALIQPLIDAKPTLQNITMVPWRYITSASFFGAEPLSPSSCVTGNNRNLYGGSIKSYHIATWNKFFADLQAFYASNLNAQSSIFFIQQFSKDVVQAVPDDATAYPHRDITAHLLWNFGYNDTSLEDTVNAFARRTRSDINATSGFDGLRMYVSYGHGDEGLIPLYSERKLPRLQALKKKWDPKGLFSFNQPLL